MKNKILSLLSLFALIILMACGSRNMANRTMGPVLRAAIDAPATFEGPAGTTLGTNACKSPLTDPRDGTEITMQTAFGGERVGDYAVPNGKYGVKNGELLRINCATGEVVGIVKR